MKFLFNLKTTEILFTFLIGKAIHSNVNSYTELVKLRCKETVYMSFVVQK